MRGAAFNEISISKRCGWTPESVRTGAAPHPQQAVQKTEGEFASLHLVRARLDPSPHHAS